MDEWTPHRVVGTAIHAGIATWLRPQIVGGKSISSEPLDPYVVALGVLTDGHVQQDAYSLDTLKALVRKGVKALTGFIESEILPGARVIAVEMPDPDQDVRLGTHRLHRIVDCILERAGALEVWDWKSKIRLDESYWHETSRATLHSWQLLDYSWHVTDWDRQGLLVRPQLPTLVGGTLLPSARPVRYAAHGLVILGPKLMVKAIPIPITEARLTQWHAQALAVWQEMYWNEVGEMPIRMNWEACTDKRHHWGKECPYLPACHDLAGNESVFGGVYRQTGGTP